MGTVCAKPNLRGESPSVFSVKSKVAPIGVLSVALGRIFWGNTHRLRGTLLCVLMFVFRSLKTERSGRPRNAKCLAEASTTECDEGSNPVEDSEYLAAPIFF